MSIVKFIKNDHQENFFNTYQLKSVESKEYATGMNKKSIKGVHSPKQKDTVDVHFFKACQMCVLNPQGLRTSDNDNPEMESLFFSYQPIMFWGFYCVVLYEFDNSQIFEVNIFNTHGINLYNYQYMAYCAL